MDEPIVVTVGKIDFKFNVTDRAYNKFMDAVSQGKAVLPAYNLLSSTVENEQHAKLKGLLTNDENQPKAALVMNVVGIISDEFTSDLPNVVKTRTSSASSSKETDLNNS